MRCYTFERCVHARIHGAWVIRGGSVLMVQPLLCDSDAFTVYLKSNYMRQLYVCCRWCKILSSATFTVENTCNISPIICKLYQDKTNKTKTPTV